MYNKLNVLFFLGISLTAAAQTTTLPSGLFRSAEGFQQNQVLLGVDCQSEKHRIRLHEFIGKPFVTVIHSGKSYQYNKDSLFGYRDCEGQSFRFVADNQHYPIINPTESVLIYKLVQPPIAKAPGYTKLYFSKDARSPVEVLTLANLKNAFPQNHPFHDRLDAQFGNGGDLSAYDAMHRMTKINWLLKESR
ncbi:MULTISPECIES: hypothetical protein [Spirosoma]|uniref:Uncharacterized protein n=1 Tax=Spirosoma linguale (strain ATCC 33905 / DSM 74 / LMG 10896 / Claus 1) TaxID=504472 RepID=D2QVL0_SPILD|nr:hypothetical protein [Spirosoma sp. 209]ADB42842.1 hypothetical protein Slin_6895 [Spirosoma linguale DSM 74]